MGHGGANAGPGVTRGGSDHGWGGEHALWCCHGTGIEATAMLPEHFVYFRCSLNSAFLSSILGRMYLKQLTAVWTSCTSCI